MDEELTRALKRSMQGAGGETAGIVKIYKIGEGVRVDRDPEGFVSLLAWRGDTSVKIRLDRPQAQALVSIIGQSLTGQADKRD